MNEYNAKLSIFFKAPKFYSAIYLFYTKKLKILYTKRDKFVLKSTFHRDKFVLRGIEKCYCSCSKTSKIHRI